MQPQPFTPETSSLRSPAFRFASRVFNAATLVALIVMIVLALHKSPPPKVA